MLLPNLEARLIRDDTNSTNGKAVEDANPGDPGELWIRGPTVMKVLDSVFMSYFLVYRILF